MPKQIPYMVEATFTEVRRYYVIADEDAARSEILTKAFTSPSPIVRHKETSDITIYEINESTMLGI